MNEGDFLQTYFQSFDQKLIDIHGDRIDYEMNTATKLYICPLKKNVISWVIYLHISVKFYNNRISVIKQVFKIFTAFIRLCRARVHTSKRGMGQKTLSIQTALVLV